MDARVYPTVRTALSSVSLAATLLWLPTGAVADELRAARSALASGDTAAASAAIERRLAAAPTDLNARFLKGVLLAEQGRVREALAVFLALTQDHPERAEPYNNLAVIYAGQGDYERARAALEMAVRVKPDYATAHENLGDVHARLAAQAYERAAGLDSSSESARAKLRLARGLVDFARSDVMPRSAAASR